MIVEIRLWLFVLMCIPAFFGVIILSIITAGTIDKIKELRRKRSSWIARKILKLEKEKEGINNHIVWLRMKAKEKSSKN